MSYTPPAHDAVDFSFEGAAAYTPPAHDAVDFSFQESVTGTFAGAVAITGAFAGTVSVSQINGTFAGTVGVFGEAVGGHGVAATVDAQILPTGEFIGAAGVAGQMAGAVALSAAFSCIVERYEARGEVRDNGILVNRRVRIYNRATGALINEADTDTGAFAIHVGFAALEVYAIPIDLASGATDFAPPCANRVMTVLAGT